MTQRYCFEDGEQVFDGCDFKVRFFVGAHFSDGIRVSWNDRLLKRLFACQVIDRYCCEDSKCRFSPQDHDDPPDRTPRCFESVLFKLHVTFPH
jgi:hypothetical protein